MIAPDFIEGLTPYRINKALKRHYNGSAWSACLTPYRINKALKHYGYAGIMQ